MALCITGDTPGIALIAASAPDRAQADLGLSMYVVIE
jgi:hypothetical protein